LLDVRGVVCPAWLPEQADKQASARFSGCARDGGLAGRDAERSEVSANREWMRDAQRRLKARRYCAQGGRIVQARPP